ncbi:transcriptional regulator [Rhizobium sp. CF142]|nr:transcriptional regulator [Rhizobium sp. CF142]
MICQFTLMDFANMPNLDKFDIAILKCLQEDARATNVEIAEKVNLSPSPCLRRIRNLEKLGVIRRYTADIDRKEVGLGLTVFVEFKVARHSKENSEAQQAALLAIPEIVSCFLISGTADFLAEVVVEDLSAYERLLTETLLTLPNVTDIRSNFAIRSIKTHGPLKLPERN